MKKQLPLQMALRMRLDNLRARNPQYSIRSFAKRAGISPATLSLILKGKRKISKKLALKVCEHLALDPQERAEIIAPFFEDTDPVPQKKVRYSKLTEDQYQVMGDWRSFALLNLIETQQFRNDPAWISKRLGIKQHEVLEILSRLNRLDMITEKKGKLARKVSNYRTADDVTNYALRKSHRQSLELAEASLENHPVNLRDFTLLTFAFDVNKLSMAKTLIRNFQDDLLSTISKDSKPDEVYRLAIQLIPLTTPQTGGREL